MNLTNLKNIYHNDKGDYMKFKSTQTTIGDCCSNRKNNLDFIRFIAAAFVIYSHSFVLTNGNYNGELMVIFTKNNWSFGNFSVATFFILSGFLITQSYMNNPNILIYLKKRILRIIPALTIVILLSTFILGPIISTLPVSDYFSSRETYSYLKNIFFVPVYSLPGVFSGLINASINGSLWTIGYEFFFYIFVAILGILGFYKYKNSNLILFILFLYLNLYKQNLFVQTFTIFKILDLYSLIELGLYFTMGMMVYTYKDKIKLDNNLALISLIGLLLFWYQGNCIIPFVIFGSYLLFYFGFNNRINLSNFSKKGDYSYGMYIYAFPIQQLYIYLFNGRMNSYINFALAFITTLLFAILSWYLIEKPCLKLKKINLIKRRVEDENTTE